MKKDIQLENYILKSADFAIPILLHWEQLVKTACPEVEVKLKWGMPHFEYKNKNLCHMASFKTHCAFGFWNAKVMNDPDKILDTENAMGSFGRITSLKDLPNDKIFVKYILEAKRTIDEDIKLPEKSKTEKEKAIVIHPDFLDALQRYQTAFLMFEKFSYSHKKEYTEWINDAKTDATRNKRISTAIEWIGEGKSKEWRYKK